MTKESICTDQNIPAYPSGLLPDNEKYDPPRYDGSLDDLTLRRNVKLYNLWLLWSNLRKDDKLFTMLQTAKDENQDTDMFYLKSMMVLSLDRMGKILVDTNIVEELKLTDRRVHPLREEVSREPSVPLP